MCRSKGGGGDNGASAREAARQAQQDAAIAQIDELFGVRGANAAQKKAEREAQYSKVRDDVINYYRPDLDRQKAEAERALKFSLAGRGLTGGSAEIDQRSNMQDRYLRGVMALTNKGDAAANEMRGADSRTRLDMIGRINAGADAGTALNSSMNEMTANANAARDAALGQGVGSFFDDMLFLQRAKSDYLSGQQLQQSMSPYFSPKTSTSGSSGTRIKVGS